MEANFRGIQSGEKVYVHVVGLGLGVWMFNPEIQNELYLRAFQNVLEQIDLSQISDIDFSWIEPPKKSSAFKDGKAFKGKSCPKIRLVRNYRDEYLQQKQSFEVAALFKLLNVSKSLSWCSSNEFAQQTSHSDL